MREPDSTLIESRRAARRETMAPSTVRASGATPIDVVALDVSATGVRIKTASSLKVGQEISIGLAGAGVTRAYVAWKRGDEYGCAFDGQLSPETEARAFSNSAPVQLGTTISLTPATEAERLDELFRQHRHFALPWDAIFALAAAGAALGGALWMTLHG